MCADRPSREPKRGLTCISTFPSRCTVLAFLSVDQRLDNNSRSEALATLGQLDALNAVVAGLSSLMIEQIKGLHLHVDRAAKLDELRQSIKAERLDRGACVKDVQIQF